MINQNNLNLDIKDPQQIKILRISNLERENNKFFRWMSAFILVDLIFISFVVININEGDSGVIVNLLAFVIPLTGVVLLYLFKYLHNNKKINQLEQAMDH